VSARSGEAATVVGIHVAASRPSVAVALRGGRTLEVLEWHEAAEGAAGEHAALLGWITTLGPSVVGVGAPQRPRRVSPDGTARQRRCDAELAARRIAVHQVPTAAEAAAGGSRYAWVSAGWTYFKELGRRGYERPADGWLPGSLGQAPAALEVYPFAGFVTLLGGTPPARTTREGLRLRVLVLRSHGVQWDEYFDHESLDALMAGLTAWRFWQGQATDLGDDRDGRIWLPVPPNELRDSYARLTPREARAALRRA
jgi:predicted nuclease with RNAse H fold